MLDILLQITAFVVTVLALVSVHEWGHMVVARMLGIKVLRYSIGFGKTIWSRTSKAGTEYVVAILPLGGYVKLLDEREGTVLPNERGMAFNNQPLWSRVLVVIAGPLTNFIFAIIAYWLMFSIGFETLKPIVHKIQPDTPAALAGVQPNSQITSIDGRTIHTWQNAVLAIVERMGEQDTMTITAKPVQGGEPTQYTLDLSAWKVDKLNPDPLRSLGVLPYSPDMPAKFDEVVADGPAALAGLKPGDVVTQIDDQKITQWVGLVRYISVRPDKTVTVHYTRDGETHQTQMTIGSRRVLSGFRKVGFVGIRALPIAIPDSYKMNVNYSLLGAFVPAVQETYNFVAFNVIVFKKMIIGEISLRSLGGPITIFKTADRAFRQGFIVFLGFLALISVMLGFINILPVPGLDGGHLLMFFIEAVIRRPLSTGAEILVTRIGFMMLLTLIFAATFNDITRIFS